MVNPLSLSVRSAKVSYEKEEFNMPRIIFRNGDKDGKYEDYLVDPEITLLQFDGFGGLGSPRGRYQKTNEVINEEGVDSTVWVLIDPMR